MAKEKETYFLLLWKIAYFFTLVLALIALHIVVGVSSLDEDAKLWIQGIDFYITILYLIYFGFSGLWFLIRRDFFQREE